MIILASPFIYLTLYPLRNVLSLLLEELKACDITSGEVNIPLILFIYYYPPGSLLQSQYFLVQKQVTK